jgi:hypothetical protein
LNLRARRLAQEDRIAFSLRKMTARAGL